MPWLCVLQKSAGMFFSFVLGSGSWMVSGRFVDSPRAAYHNTACIIDHNRVYGGWLDESNHRKKTWNLSEGVSQQPHVLLDTCLPGSKMFLPCPPFLLCHDQSLKVPQMAWDFWRFNPLWDFALGIKERRNTEGIEWNWIPYIIHIRYYKMINYRAQNPWQTASSHHEQHLKANR